MARMAGTEPEANHSTDIVANNKEVTVTPSKLRKWRAGAKLEARYVASNPKPSHPCGTSLSLALI